MGMIRKFTSIGTLGMVDYRNGKERSLRYAKQTRNAARFTAAQTGRLRNTVQDESARLEAAIDAKTVSPPGWHPDPLRVKRLRWWDGSAWTENTSD